MKKLMFLAILVFSFSVLAYAQPRPTEKTSAPPSSTPKTPAPTSIPTRYEGGLFGFSENEKGTLKFDDDNERLVFFGKNNKERFSIPYKAMQIVYPQSASVRSNTGTVVSAVPYAGIFGQFIKKKRRYMIVNFDDPDVKARGLVNFKIDDKELLDSVISTLGEKAGMTRRGDAYYRPK